MLSIEDSPPPYPPGGEGFFNNATLQDATGLGIPTEFKNALALIEADPSDMLPMKMTPTLEDIVPLTIILVQGIANGALAENTIDAIKIAANPHYTTTDYAAAMRNELLNHQLLTRGILKYFDPKKGEIRREWVNMCTKKNGKTSAACLKKLQGAIRHDTDNVERLIRAVNKPAGTRTPPEQNTVDILKSTIGEQPARRISEKSFNKNSPGIDDAIRKGLFIVGENGRILAGKNHPDYPYRVIAHDPRHYVRTFAKDESPIERVLAWLRTLRKQLSAIENPKGPYHDRNPVERSTEAVTFFAEAANGTAHIIAPNVTKFVCDYFKMQ